MVYPIGPEVVPGIGWVQPNHPEHPDHIRLKINAALDAYEAHTNREPPVAAEDFRVWHAEAMRLLNEISLLVPKREENELDKLLREANEALRT